MKRNLSIFAAVFGALVLCGLALARDGRDLDGRIAFVDGPDIYTMNPDGSDVRQLTNLGPNNFALWESWSPDGRQLVFTEFPPNVPPQLWLMNADGTNQHLLFSDPVNAAYFPSFSPDGNDVVFSFCPPNPEGDACGIYRVRNDGTGLTELTPFEPGINDFFPVYSRDSLSIAFTSFNRDGILGAVYLVDANGTNLRRLTPPDLDAGFPSWSPDGKLGFSTRCCNPQNQDIWVINPDSKDLRRLTGSAESDEKPATYSDFWFSVSPGGDQIVFLHDDFTTSSSGIFVMSTDGSERRMLVSRPLHKTDESHRQRRRSRPVPHEIEMGGFYPQWGPTVRP